MNSDMTDRIGHEIDAKHVHMCCRCRWWAEMTHDEGECCRLQPQEHPEMVSEMQRAFVRETVVSDCTHPMVSHSPVSRAAQSMLIPKSTFFCYDFLHKDDDGPASCPQRLPVFPE